MGHRLSTSRYTFRVPAPVYLLSCVSLHSSNMGRVTDTDGLHSIDEPSLSQPATAAHPSFSRSGRNEADVMLRPITALSPDRRKGSIVRP